MLIAIEGNPHCFALALITAVCFIFLPALSPAVEHPTTEPYEVRPSPDGLLAYLITPTPEGLTIEKDVMVVMPDGVKLACNIVRPNKEGKFPVVLSMTPYGKDLTPPQYKPDGTPVPGAYIPYLYRVYSYGPDLGHMKISMLASWEAPDPVFWASND